MQSNPGKIIGRSVSIIIVLFNLAIGFFYLFEEIHALREDLLSNTDFSVFYSEGLMIREGNAARIYDVDLEKKYQIQVMEGSSFEGGILPFVYPPHVALLFVPFSIFPRQIAVALWMLVQLIVLVFFLSRLKYYAPTWTRWEYLLAGSAIVAFFPLFYTFTIGAFSLIILTCTLEIYASLRTKRDAQAGLWFFTGLIKPQLLILPGVVLFMTRRWRSILIVTLAGLGTVVISSLILGWHIWPTYLQLASTFTGHFGNFGFYPDAMYNFRSLATIMLGIERETLINILSYAGLGGSILVTIWIWRGPFRPDAPDFPLRMALTLLMGILFNLHAYPQEGLQLVGPALFFYDYMRRRGLPTRIYSILALSYPYLFLLLWLTTFDSQFSLFPILTMFGMLFVMAVALYNDRRVKSGTTIA